jgi:hypothetical protein
MSEGETASAVPSGFHISTVRTQKNQMQLGISNITDCRKTKALYQGRASALPQQLDRKNWALAPVVT